MFCTSFNTSRTMPFDSLEKLNSFSYKTNRYFLHYSSLYDNIYMKCWNVGGHRVLFNPAACSLPKIQVFKDYLIRMKMDYLCGSV